MRAFSREETYYTEQEFRYKFKNLIKEHEDKLKKIQEDIVIADRNLKNIDSEFKAQFAKRSDKFAQEEINLKNKLIAAGRQESDLDIRQKRIIQDERTLENFIREEKKRLAKIDKEIEEKRKINTIQEQVNVVERKRLSNKEEQLSRLENEYSDRILNLEIREKSLGKKIQELNESIDSYNNLVLEVESIKQQQKKTLQDLKNKEKLIDNERAQIELSTKNNNNLLSKLKVSENDIIVRENILKKEFKFLNEEKLRLSGLEDELRERSKHLESLNIRLDKRKQIIEKLERDYVHKQRGALC